MTFPPYVPENPSKVGCGQCRVPKGVTMAFGETIYVVLEVLEYPYIGSIFEILFWSKDLELVKDWIEKKRNSDTSFEYFEVKQLIEW